MTGGSRSVDDGDARVTVKTVVRVDHAGLGRVADRTAAQEVGGERHARQLAHIAALEAVGLGGDDRGGFRSRRDPWGVGGAADGSLAVLRSWPGCFGMMCAMGRRPVEVDELVECWTMQTVGGAVAPPGFTELPVAADVVCGGASRRHTRASCGRS